ncbi:MAG: acetyltransferase [Alphaproteobacteria bacterium]|nr:acetyltransferase [Alphaproteobacteria bacterium]
MKQQQIVIIGGGGHTRVLIGMVQAAGLPLRGIVTANAALLGSVVLEVPVLGLEGEVDLDPTEVMLVNGVGNHATGKGPGLAPRTALYQRYRAMGFDFPPIISPQAVVHAHVAMGEGVQVMAGAVIQPGVIIGENSIINTCAAIDHDVVLSPHCHIAPAAVLCGYAVVGEGTHIGAGAVIIDKVRIGNRAVIGAGATVTKHVPDAAVIRPAPAVTEML